MEIKHSLSGPHHHFDLWLDNHKVGHLDWDQAADEMQIKDLHIKEFYRQKGYASELLTSLFKFAQENNLPKIYLEVRLSNKAAISLYEKNGFKQSGMRKDYYAAPKENALLLEKIIQL